MKAGMPLLRLPLLHPDTLPLPEPPRGAAHLWPGLPDMPQGFWRPDAYPFTPAQAAACLEDMRAMSEAALSGMPVEALAARGCDPQAARDAEEIQEVARFARSGTADASRAGAGEIRRTAAQKVLLWAWLLEERRRELRELALGYGAGKARLAEALGLERGEEAPPGFSALDLPLDDQRDVLPPWRPVLHNAALFLPPGMALLCNSPAMRADMEECLSLTPLPPREAAALGLPEGGPRLLQVTAPLWRVLGRTRPHPDAPWLDAETRIVVPASFAPTGPAAIERP